MFTHYIILSSSYSLGKRIALEMVIEKEYNFTKSANSILKAIKEQCGNDVSISTHLIQTDSPEWKSVVERDFFFKKVEVVKSAEQFIALIQKDRKLEGLDVAKYILTKIHCTHLKLEKLTYFCYAEYMCQYHKKLFYDDIYAYQFGPVVKSVYQKLRRKGYKEVDEKDIDSEKIYELPAKSRILFAEDGLNKVRCIEETIQKYGSYQANELVELTHRENTPWSVSGKGNMKNAVIKDESILEYHKNEVIAQ